MTNGVKTQTFHHYLHLPFHIHKSQWRATFCLICLLTITLIFLNNRSSTLNIPSTYKTITVDENVAQEIELVNEEWDQINKDEYGHCLKKSSSINFTYNWTLRPSACGPDIDVILLVKSSIYRAPLRWSLRDTWARNISLPGYNVKRIFLTGVAPKGQCTNLLKDENSKYDDILQSDFEDTYKSVSKKIYTGMRFVKLYCSSVSWILVADDDASVLPWNVLTYLSILSNNKNSQSTDGRTQDKILAGFDITGAKAIRDKKDRWYVSPEEYSCPVYPPYVSGSLYALTYRTLEKFYLYSRAFDPLFLDDVLFGVFARLGGAKLHHLPGDKFNFFCNNIISSHSAGERSPDYLACHGADLPSEQWNLWRQFCSQPIPGDRAIIGILNRIYCSSLL